MYIVCARHRIGVGHIATAKVNNGQGVTARPGARFGPSGIRQGSSRISPDAAWSIYTGMSYYHEGARMGVHPASTDLERCSKQSNNERHLLHHVILASCVLEASIRALEFVLCTLILVAVLVVLKMLLRSLLHEANIASRDTNHCDEATS